MKVSNNVKALRLAAGMSQPEVAAKLKISTPSVTKWERGRANPDLENAFKLAELFGVSISEVVIQDTGA